MPVPWKHPSPPPSSTFDLELLKKEIGIRFSFYDIRFTPQAVLFFCNIDKKSLEENFEALRISLSKIQYIPLLRKENGENIIYVIKKPEKKEKPIFINLILLIATIITTILTGSLLHLGFADLQSVPNILEVF
jgi:hypothetical protein